MNSFLILVPLTFALGAAGETSNAPKAGLKPAQPLRVLPEGQLPKDGRLGPPRNLRDPYHPWTPPSSLTEWEQRFDELRVQLKVATGLWPEPERTPLNAVVHGKIERDDYTVEKVYFQSYPGHYVCGNLYRPKSRSGKLPAILSPHGHWQNGRFYDAGEKGAKDQIEQGAEKFEPNARYPLQARMASLARMGCVVFHYDMVGNADSTVLPHQPNLNDPQAILRLQTSMGLQTWNSIRALDFLLSLPDVDPTRVGVTGASGGGTQTFMLCALDDRPAVGFPAVMVSTAMQGGCTCENAPLLRVGTGNVEFAAMFAPKPYGMSGADDWTIDIETKGLPELRKLYELYRAPDNVMAKCYPQFKHNYNQVSRQLMYAWMNRHLALGVDNVEERPIDPIPPEQLSVYDENLPQPGDAKSYDELRVDWTRAAEQWLASIQPHDRRSYLAYREQLLPALQSMVVDRAPPAKELQATTLGTVRKKGYTIDKLLIGRRPKELLLPAESIPAVVFLPADWQGRMVVWIHADGHAGLWDAEKGEPIAAVKSLLDQRIAVFSADVFLTGEFHPSDGTTAAPAVDGTYAGYTYCYNRTVLANRVHDVLTAIGCANHLYASTSVDLVGLGEAGRWGLLAKALAGDLVDRTVADFDGFSFQNVQDVASVDMLPGALKYGDLTGLAVLCAPDPLYALGTDKLDPKARERFTRGYDSAGDPEALKLGDSEEEAIQWLTGR